MSKFGWVSHRGLKIKASENTAAAFDHAVENGFTCLETDLRLSKDGEIVLAHDPSLERIAGVAKRVSSLSTSELMGLALPKGGQILTFEGFLSRYEDQSWIFDIKPETALGVIDKLREIVDSSGNREWFLAKSRFLFWSAADQSYFLDNFPGAHCLARQTECYRAGVSSLLGASFLGGIQPGKVYAMPSSFMGYDLFSEGFVRKFHDRGAKLMAYLPEGEQVVRRAYQAGYDEVITNFKISL